MDWNFEITVVDIVEAERELYQKVARRELPPEVAQAISLRLAAIPPEQPTITSGFELSDYWRGFKRRIFITSSGSLESSQPSDLHNEMKACAELSVRFTVKYIDVPYSSIDSPTLTGVINRSASLGSSGTRVSEPPRSAPR